MIKLSKEDCKSIAIRVRMVFNTNSFSGRHLKITPAGFELDEECKRRNEIADAVWDAEWRQLNKICDFIETLDHETEERMRKALEKIFYD